MEINSDKLSELIDESFKEMIDIPELAESSFAVFESKGIQVHILLTKEEGDFLDITQEDVISKKDT